MRTGFAHFDMFDWFMLVTYVAILLVGFVFCFAGSVRRPVVGFLAVVGLFLMLVSTISRFAIQIDKEVQRFLEPRIDLFLDEIGWLCLIMAVVVGLVRRDDSKPVTERYELTREAFLKGWPVRARLARVFFYLALLFNGLVLFTFFETLGDMVELAIALVSILLTMLATAAIVESNRFLRGPRIANFVFYLIIFAPFGLLAAFMGLGFAAKKVKKQFDEGTEKLLIQA